MNSSDLPSRISKPFAINGDKNTIPVDSTTTTDSNGVATFNKGFPPVTMQPLSAGGLPPDGKDVNGVLYSVTLQQQWQNSGMGYQFNSDFASVISGYPKGAFLPNATLSGFWVNLNEANSISPESSTGAVTGWAPLANYGFTTISGLASTSVVMSSIQAAKDRIVLTGTLTANINLVFPAWTRSWVVANNCSGAFSVTCKTASGTGVTIPAGQSATIVCDGTNIFQDTTVLGYPGMLLNTQVFTASGTYTPSLGTRSVIVEVLGAGGAGGGVSASPSGVVAGAGGGGGAYGRRRITSAFAGVDIVVGAGGSGSSGGAGGNGGLSRFGNIVVCNGGAGGGTGGPTSSQVVTSGAAGQGGKSTTSDVTRSGGAGGVGLIGPAFSLSGAGGDTFYSPQTPYGSILGPGLTAGNNGPANSGAGGSGAVGFNNGSSAPGGDGGSGLVIVWEYS